MHGNLVVLYDVEDQRRKTKTEDAMYRMTPDLRAALIAAVEAEGWDDDYKAAELDLLRSFPNDAKLMDDDGIAYDAAGEPITDRDVLEDDEADVPHPMVTIDYFGVLHMAEDTTRYRMTPQLQVALVRELSAEEWDPSAVLEMIDHVLSWDATVGQPFADTDGVPLDLDGNRVSREDLDMFWTNDEIQHPLKHAERYGIIRLAGRS